MNCKPGDLAVFVRSEAGNEGLVVRCIRLATEAEMRQARRHTDLPVWHINRPVVDAYGDALSFAQDRNLRPIRPDGITTEEVKELFSPSPAKESEKV
jgi:hypothetical protein